MAKLIKSLSNAISVTAEAVPALVQSGVNVVVGTANIATTAVNGLNVDITNLSGISNITTNGWLLDAQNDEVKSKAVRGAKIVAVKAVTGNEAFKAKIMQLEAQTILADMAEDYDIPSLDIDFSTPEPAPASA